jgi:hypothetical protein
MVAINRPASVHSLGLIVSSPELPGCFFNGLTALRENVHRCLAVQEAIDAYVRDGNADFLRADLTALGFEPDEIDAIARRPHGLLAQGFMAFH